MKLQIDISRALSCLTDFGVRAVDSLNDTLRDSAEEMEKYAKTNRPWTDRTGKARRTLEGVFGNDGNRFRVGIEGNMPYSVFLELGFGGRYSILFDTVNALTPGTLRDLSARIR